jgi:hypothetical protein
MIHRGKRVALAALSLLFILALTLSPLLSRQARAIGILQPRKLTLVAGTTDGGSFPGGSVKHQFSFTTATTNNVGSIIFLYCTTANPANPCTPPTGLNVDDPSGTGSVTLDAPGCTNATGFSVNTAQTTTNKIVIDRTPASVNSGVAVSCNFSSAINPTTANETFYVRITTTDAAAGGGTTVDQGTVAASTATAIQLTGYMPESLIFCTGATINNTGGVPDCSTASSGNINFNQDFSPADTATATSQMAASTNALTGYSITVNGVTLTNGSYTVTAMGTAGVGVRGTSQFGMNLSANTTTTSTPAVGSGITNSGTGTFNGEVLSGYDTPDNFKFATGNSVADSTNLPTDIEKYTVSYIVNVNGAQPQGTYTTTLTYICTPTF